MSAALIEAERPGFFERIDRLDRRSLGALKLDAAIEALDWYAYRHGESAAVELARQDRRSSIRNDSWRWSSGGPLRARAATYEVHRAYQNHDVAALRELTRSPHGYEITEAVNTLLPSALVERDERTAALLVLAAAHDRHATIGSLGLWGDTIPDADHFRWITDSPAGWWFSPVSLRGSRLAVELATIRGRLGIEEANISAGIIAVVCRTLDRNKLPTPKPRLLDTDTARFAFVHLDDETFQLRREEFTTHDTARLVHDAISAGHDAASAITRFVRIEESLWQLGSEFETGLNGRDRDAWCAGVIHLPAGAVLRSDTVFGVVMQHAVERGLDLATVTTLLRDWHGSVGALFDASAALR